jgi:hypothetical protein
VRAIAENLWVLRYPLSLLGADFGRRVTVIRLWSGELVIHSTGPFSADDIVAINALGKPVWLVEATNVHDTFAREGSTAFPLARYFAPPAFEKFSGIATQSLAAPPADWSGELDVLPLGGVPKVREHAFFHRPSRTLIVADLLFNVGSEMSAWTRLLLRLVAGLKGGPGVSRIFRKLAIRDPAALRTSLRKMLEWDFDRVIVAHGNVIETGGKRALTDALTAAALL